MKRSLLWPIAALVATLLVLLFALPLHETGGRILLRVATTTSLYDTGLLEKLADAFRRKHPEVVVQFIPVGSGRALRLAADGSVCLVLVHAPNLEARYVEAGVLQDHTIFAYNYFVIVGPRGDPANVSRASSVVDAFRRIAEAGREGRAVFVSRGDCSGTYVRERLVWRMAGLDPRPGRDPWYIETGSGMASTLRVANEKGAYTLSDIGTFARLSANGAIPNLVLLYPRGRIDPILINVYSAYLVRGCSGEELKAAKMFLAFLASREGQELIAGYRVAGIQLFHPALGAGLNLTRVWGMLAEEPVPSECR